jgi:hypothetical protein
MYSSGTNINTLAEPLYATFGSLDANMGPRDGGTGRGGATFTADPKADAFPARPQLNKQDTS